MGAELGHFINGKNVAGTSGRLHEVYNPTIGEVQAKVALASRKEVEAAISAAEKAFPGWAGTNPQRRARVLFKFKELVEKDMNNLAKMLSSEHGKILPDARGDVQRGLDVIEFACGAPHLLKVDFTDGAGTAIVVLSMRQPLSVCAGITTFNFPARIPMWMFGVAIA
ncbi:MAG: aldehyde dehydrogenase family protein, partial [Amphiplicatus sp.]